MALAVALFVYFTEFYYAWPDYAFGLRSDSGDVLRQASVRLLPKGEFEFGIVGPDPKSYEDPPWPLPEKRVEIDVPSGVRKPFKGRLTIVLKKNKNGYYAEVEQSPLNR